MTDDIHRRSGVASGARHATTGAARRDTLAALIERIEFRALDYMRVDAGGLAYAIEARKDGGPWQMVVENNKVMTYATAAERDDVLETLAALRARMESER